MDCSYPVVPIRPIIHLPATRNSNGTVNGTELEIDRNAEIEGGLPASLDVSQLDRLEQSQARFVSIQTGSPLGRKLREDLPVMQGIRGAAERIRIRLNGMYSMPEESECSN